MRCLVIDNYRAEHTGIQRLSKAVRAATGKKPVVVKYTQVTAQTLEAYDSVILSGSGTLLTYPEEIKGYEHLLRLVAQRRRPLLGVCFGHQLIGLAFDGKVVHKGRRFEGFYPIRVIQNDPLFRGLPLRLVVYESHYEVVERVGPDLLRLAKGPSEGVEVIRHRSRPVYGVQFHPERYDRSHPHGKKVLENFFTISS